VGEQLKVPNRVIAPMNKEAAQVLFKVIWKVAMPASPGKDPIREQLFSRLSLLKPDTFLESTPPRPERYNYRTKPPGLVVVIPLLGPRICL
jgi:hypothetical protein